MAAVAGNMDYDEHVADLIAPAKLATLGPRGANARVQKAVAQLETALKAGLKIEKVTSQAVAIAGYTNTAGATGLLSTKGLNSVQNSKKYSRSVPFAAKFLRLQDQLR